MSLSLSEGVHEAQGQSLSIVSLTATDLPLSFLLNIEFCLKTLKLLGTRTITLDPKRVFSYDLQNSNPYLNNSSLNDDGPKERGFHLT